jgi:hypothetical protein
MPLILPNATLGVVHRLGEIMSADFKNGVCLFVRGNLCVLRIFKDGEKFYEVEFGEHQTEQMAGFFGKGADMIARHGGSGLPPPVDAAPQVIGGAGSG